MALNSLTDRKDTMKIDVKIRVMALVCSALLLLTCLCACKSNEDYKAVMTYGKYSITEPMYRYWVSSYKRNILASIDGSSDTDEFWSREQTDGVTIEQYYSEIIDRRIKDYLISQALFDQYDLKLSDEVITSIDDDLAEKAEYYGGEDELNKALSEMSLNIDILRDIYLCEERHDAVYEKLYGRGGVEEATAAQIIDYYNNNYSRIQYIVFYKSEFVTDENGDTVYDDDGNAVTQMLTGDKLDKKLSEISECENRIRNGESFAELRSEYSQYDTSSSYPNGFFVSDNEISIWGKDIVDKAKEAKSGNVFRVDEEEAVYLVLKCELTEFDKLSDVDLSQLTSLNTYVTKYLFDRKYGQLEKEVKVYNEILSEYSLSKIAPNKFYSL